MSDKLIVSRAEIEHIASLDASLVTAIEVREWAIRVLARDQRPPSQPLMGDREKIAQIIREKVKPTGYGTLNGEHLAADAILASLPEQGGEPFGITGASNETEALAIALWAHRCPGIVMLDDDLPYYEAAAKAAFDTLDGAAPPLPELVAAKQALRPFALAAGVCPVFDANAYDNAAAVLASLDKDTPNAD